MIKTDEVIKMYGEYVAPCYSYKPIVLVKGNGTRVWDADGKVYLDFLAGIAVVSVGHAHPRVVKAIQNQAAVLTHVSNLYYNEPQARLAKMLSGISLNGKCFFCNSGAEANEALIKLARLWGHANEGRYEIITMRNSFHGRTLATLTATGQTKVQTGFEPLVPGFSLADYNDLAGVKATVTDKTIAVLVEAIQGEGGIVPAHMDFMKGLRTLCDENDLLLLCDEVQCGLGRTGNWFGYQAYGIKPDAISVAKGLGNGYPIGAVITCPRLGDVFQPGKHASTFGGSPLACAAALATLETIEDERLVERAASAGKRFKDGLAAIAEKYEHVSEVRGMGLMLGLVLDQPAQPLVEKLIEYGLLCLATAERVVRFLPPLTVKDSEIDEALDMINDACAEWHGMAADGDDEDDETPEPAAEAETAVEPAAPPAEVGGAQVQAEQGKSE